MKNQVSSFRLVKIGSKNINLSGGKNTVCIKILHTHCDVIVVTLSFTGEGLGCGWGWAEWAPGWSPLDGPQVVKVPQGRAFIPYSPIWNKHGDNRLKHLVSVAHGKAGGIDCDGSWGRITAVIVQKIKLATRFNVFFNGYNCVAHKFN